MEPDQEKVRLCIEAKECRAQDGQGSDDVPKDTWGHSLHFQTRRAAVTELDWWGRFEGKHWPQKDQIELIFPTVAGLQPNWFNPTPSTQNQRIWVSCMTSVNLIDFIYINERIGINHFLRFPKFYAQSCKIRRKTESKYKAYVNAQKSIYQDF